MLYDLIVFGILATSLALTNVVKENVSSCSKYEYPCDDGACVSLDKVCDGHKDCVDGNDEFPCEVLFVNKSLGDTSMKRLKRQTKTCQKDQWQCKDRTCIPFDGKCDGVVDCPDKSDETHALCRNSECQSNLFKCTYGACVDGTAPCNGIQDCADSSDELVPMCRIDTDIVRGQFNCLDGSSIPDSSHCDGEVNCPDGSDETVRSCGDKTCQSYFFQCAYGACVDRGSDCNGKTECADGSDEDDELCGRITAVTNTSTTSTTSTTTTTTTKRPPNKTDCVLPPYPKYGSYVVTKVPKAKPGQILEYAQLTYSCNAGYGVVGTVVANCVNGLWTPKKLPKCVRFCALHKDPSVKYRCALTGSHDTYGYRDCNAEEPVGTSAKPECNEPNYYNTGILPNMKCTEDGTWDHVITCLPECGRITPYGEQFVTDGWSAQRGELPWHVGIYRKTTTPYMQICGGSLVSNNVVISAAHCFWSDIEKKLPAANFAVAVGKLYRPWNDPMDKDAQKSDVKEIKIPERFQGSTANFQDDIALVILKTPFDYKTYVRPVCMDFDENFDRIQLEDKSLGKVAGWGITNTGKPSPILQTANLPVVEINRCINEVPPEFREYITSDKICAGSRNGTALCKGDSGGGLALPSTDKGIIRYYLRGIVSTASTNGTACNAYAYTTFTQILKHKDFIKEDL